MKQAKVTKNHDDTDFTDDADFTMAQEHPATALQKSQLLITKRQFGMLKSRARELQIPISELVRRILDDWIGN